MAIWRKLMAALEARKRGPTMTYPVQMKSGAEMCVRFLEWMGAEKGVFFHKHDKQAGVYFPMPETPEQLIAEFIERVRKGA